MPFKKNIDVSYLQKSMSHELMVTVPEQQTDHEIDPFFMTLEEIVNADIPVAESSPVFINSGDSEDVSFFMTLEEIDKVSNSTEERQVLEVNPFTGENTIASSTFRQPFKDRIGSFSKRKDTSLPQNPFTGREVSGVSAKSVPVGFVEEPKLDRTRAMSTFKQFYSQIESANKVLAQHALVCTGENDHVTSKIPINKTTLSMVREKAFERVMNTDLGKKMAAQEMLSVAEERELSELTAQVSDEILGTETLKVVRELNSYEDFSWQDGQASRLMIELANGDHVHGANCSHGDPGGIPVSVNLPSVSSPSLSRSASLFDSDNHANHNKLVVCKNCTHKQIAHVHGKEGPTCPRCKKGKMQIAKKSTEFV